MSFIIAVGISLGITLDPFGGKEDGNITATSTAVSAAAGRPHNNFGQTASDDKNNNQGPPFVDKNSSTFPGKGYRVQLDFDKGRDRLTLPMSNGKKIGFNKIKTDKGNVWSGVSPDGKSTATFIDETVGAENFQVGSVVFLDGATWTICQLYPENETPGMSVMECMLGEDYPEEEEPSEDDYDLVDEEPLTEPLHDEDDNNRRSLQQSLISTIDVMVPWTPEAECAASRLAYPCLISASTEATIRGIIDLAITETNVAYASSGVNIQLQLVHSYRVNYVEDTADPFRVALGDLRGSGDGMMDEVHTLREQYGADIVALIMGSTASCGRGYYGPSGKL